MATKPASGTALDTGHALYTSLLHVWGLLEGGSSPTTADSKGSNTGTLDSTGLWSTDANGPIIHNTSALVTRPVAVTQFQLAASGTEDFSIAFGVKQTSSDNNGMILGDPDGTSNYVWLRGGNYFRVNGNGNIADFTSLTAFTTYADYVLTYDYIAGVSTTLRLYKNGTITADGPVASACDLTIDALGGGFATLSLVGDLSYVYVWKNRVLSGAEATTLASNPYVIFTGGAASAPVGGLRQAKQAVKRAAEW